MKMSRVVIDTIYFDQYCYSCWLCSFIFVADCYLRENYMYCLDIVDLDVEDVYFHTFSSNYSKYYFNFHYFYYSIYCNYCPKAQH